MLSLTPSSQSPRAYDLNNLQAANIATRLQNAASAAQRAKLKAALQDGAFRYVLTAGEIGDGQTDADIVFGYDPGDIRRYGVTNASSAADVQEAVETAMRCEGTAWIPWGTDGAWNWLTVKPSGKYQHIFFYPGVRITQDDASPMIDLDGWSHCSVDGGRFFSLNATHGVRVGDNAGHSRFAHWFRVTRCEFNGEATEQEGSGDVTGFTTAAVEINRAYYGTVCNIDAAFCAAGVYGTNECNGNWILANSMRHCHVGIKVDDTTRNSDGTIIASNSIEGGETGNLYGIEVQGCSNMMVHANRIEYTGAGTAHLYVHGGVDKATRHSLWDNRCIGAIAACKLGDDSGANEVDVLSLRGGYYFSTVTVGVDCDFTEVDLPSNRSLGGGDIALLVDNSTTTILSILYDQSVTLSLTGCDTVPTGSILWVINRNWVEWYQPTITGTSNTTAATLTGLSLLARPNGTRNIMMRMFDNSATVHGMFSVASSGVITCSNSLANTGSMTNGGSKGPLSGPVGFSRH